MKRIGCALLAALLATPAVRAQDDAGLGLGDLGRALDVLEAPVDLASDLALDFGADDLIGLDLGVRSLSLLGARGFRVTARRSLSTLRLELFSIRVPLGLPVREALGVLRTLDPAAIYDTNTRYGLAGEGASAPDACAGIRCYGRAMVDWPPLCDTPVRLGMVDSAVDTDHPALAGRRIERRRFAGGAASSEHGTAVAALLAGAPDSAFPGLLPRAELFAADVFSVDDAGNGITDAVRIVTALDWIASNAPAVVNLSLAGPDGAVLAAAIARLQQAGITVVAAAGNGGADAAPQFPAAYPGVIAVTAIDRRLHAYASASRGAHLSVAAPGVDIWTPAADAAGAFRAGTSFAAPFVAAAVAVQRQRHPQLTPAQVRERVQAGARDLGDPGFDPVYGWGLLQAEPCTGAGS